MSNDDDGAMVNGEPQDDLLGFASSPAEAAAPADDLLGFAAPRPSTPNTENVPMDLLGFGAPAEEVTSNGDNASPPMDLVGFGAPASTADPSPAPDDPFAAFDAAPMVSNDPPSEQQPAEDLIGLSEPAEGALLEQSEAASSANAEPAVDPFGGIQQAETPAASTDLFGAAPDQEPVSSTEDAFGGFNDATVEDPSDAPAPEAEEVSNGAENEIASQEVDTTVEQPDLLGSDESSEPAVVQEAQNEEQDPASSENVEPVVDLFGGLQQADTSNSPGISDDLLGAAPGTDDEPVSSVVDSFDAFEDAAVVQEERKPESASKEAPNEPESATEEAPNEPESATEEALNAGTTSPPPQDEPSEEASAYEGGPADEVASPASLESVEPLADPLNGLHQGETVETPAASDDLAGGGPASPKEPTPDTENDFGDFEDSAVPQEDSPPEEAGQATEDVTNGDDDVTATPSKVEETAMEQPNVQTTDEPSDEAVTQEEDPVADRSPSDDEPPGDEEQDESSSTNDIGTPNGVADSQSEQAKELLPEGAIEDTEKSDPPQEEVELQNEPVEDFAAKEDIATEEASSAQPDTDKAPGCQEYLEVENQSTERSVMQSDNIDAEPTHEKPRLDNKSLEDEPLVDESLVDEPLEDEPLVDEPLENSKEPVGEAVEVAEGSEAPSKVEEAKDESEILSEAADAEQPAIVSPKPSKPVADVSPSWMSAADTPTGAAKAVKPKAVLERTPSATVVDLPPIEPVSSYAAPQQAEERGPDPATQAMIVDLQASIQKHLNEREFAEAKTRKAQARVKELEGVVEVKKTIEKELKETKESLKSAAKDREHLLVELDKLREARDEHERKQIVLSNRLNAAKKKEAAKANLAESLDDNVRVLQHDFETTKKQLEEVTAKKDELAKELKGMKDEAQTRLKKVETQLIEERRLNDERKKKMKSFVENKQEEIRESKSHTDELNMELSQTNRSLREHHSRWKQLHAQWVQSQTRNRELQRDINNMKKESESMSRLGDRMNVKLSQSAQETEEHKNKRLTAKSELMTVLQTLESEREVSSKLRDSIKFTFTPKALSQQQILKESLREFEHELARLSTRLGKPLPPSNSTAAEEFALEGDDEDGAEDGGNGRRTRSEIDSTHLLANLEDESQRVSQCIMALTSNIERLHILIAQSGERTCVTLFSDLLAGAAGAPDSGGETAAMTGPRIGLGNARSYGQVPTANN